MIAAVIFDLDDTLLDTGALAGARERREWGVVLSGLEAVVPFSVLEGEQAVVELPREVKRRGLATGVLTHSPRNYAEALLDRHGVKVDQMVTGSDGFPTKPDPTGLLALAKTLEVESARCVYVGDAVGDFGAAAAAGMVSVGISWSGETRVSWRHGWPDVAIDRPSGLGALLDGGGGLGPLGEVGADGGPFVPHWGSVVRLGSSTFGLGRYFPTGDRRYPGHGLSHLIIDAKEDPAAQGRLAEIFASLAELGLESPPDLVASVPPSPGKPDRFAGARTRLAEELGVGDGGELLHQLYGADDYLWTARTARAAKVRERFAASGPLAGEGIVLLDDVYTSGSQSEACRAALEEAGAGGVSIIAAAVTQDALPDPCPDCGEEGGTIKIRRRHGDGVEFRACSRYPRCYWTADL